MLTADTARAGSPYHTQESTMRFGIPVTTDADDWPDGITKAAGLIESVAIDHDDWIERNEIVSTNKRLVEENEVLRKENAFLISKLEDVNKFLAKVENTIERIANKSA
jgi:hypothetical protein